MLEFSFGVLAVAVVIFLLAHRRRANPQRRAQSARALSAGEVITLVRGLRDRSALWPEILTTLNPSGDQRVAELLHQIRGPHMFDPHTALGVIETGCREVKPIAHAREGLAAAVESMNRVVGFGR